MIIHIYLCTTVIILYSIYFFLFIIIIWDWHVVYYRWGMDNTIFSSDMMDFYLVNMYDGRNFAVRIICFYFSSVSFISSSSNDMLRSLIVMWRKCIVGGIFGVVNSNTGLILLCLLERFLFSSYLEIINDFIGSLKIDIHIRLDLLSDITCICVCVSVLVTELFPFKSFINQDVIIKSENEIHDGKI